MSQPTGTPKTLRPNDSPHPRVIIHQALRRYEQAESFIRRTDTLDDSP